MVVELNVQLGSEGKKPVDVCIGNVMYCWNGVGILV